MVKSSTGFKISSFVLTLLLVIPVLFLLFYGYGPYFVGSTAFSRALLSSIALSFFSSSVATVLIIIIFTPLAYYLARHRNPLIESLVDIPASIPHPIVGIAVIFMGSPLNPLGRFLTSLGINIYYSYLGLILALVITSAPVYIRAMQNFYESLPRSYEEFSWSLRYSEVSTFFRVIFPLSTGGIISAGLTAIARAISEFGSVSIVAPFLSGWIFNGDSPASVYIYNEYQTYFNAAITASATLIIFSLLLVFSTRIVKIVLEKLRLLY
ncbi:ABC transporter permease [Sulfolobus acidocaldarius]|uniref:Sulfate ABC transporter permease n=3 Tax=Sulfolobus acidocaldarius TaxID=2285 RepID=A0A0U2WTR5_9CREN|nr:ABC transporter permease [Sulfolobus acidocaldarius]AGE70090.1 sulfate transport system permease [Sulfolobus acidocaldarius N8]AGE72365.1 sulfate transport system permease [Sulfolobus acidocaldarius Ron12/I]ALU29490.1 sulfate ABC transporter permease [Sulfolobus acidocaldarius]ALU32219.1 sulfate ABC transporter permease [Sulfolobus acidocaldarius]WCM34117.1 ABC transporter permease subunit [Sulfolobus acidocaldarius DSM 639]